MAEEQPAPFQDLVQTISWAPLAGSGLPYVLGVFSLRVGGVGVTYCPAGSAESTGRAAASAAN